MIKPKFILLGQVYPDSFADNVAFTLRKMGYEVLTHPTISARRYSSRLFRYYRLFNQKLNSRHYSSVEEKWLLKTTKEEHPTIFLALTQSVKETTLIELKKLGIE